ncbi:MAG TPA: tRNA dihydrouridine synthase DusB [Geobacteraceae bacterium]|nr:tRNA dihydrouridine synthase DusB [Geobacteraceae bacterium]
MIKSLTIGTLTLRNNLILAPMAGITNLAVRLLARQHGASLCFTEMVSTEGLVRNGKKTLELLQSSRDDRPLGVQVFGHDPQQVAEGVRAVEEYGDLIDINMGCPVKKVVNSGAGSALLRKPEKVKDMVRAARRATKLPLTIKIRTGWDVSEHTFLEIARIAEDEGCDAITLHPRNRMEMFDGKADWDRISELKDSTGLPVIGSGDLFSACDIKDMFERTGCDGAMVARGVLGNPWIFSEASALLDGREHETPSPRERLATALRHMEMLISLLGENAALRELRKHLAWYTKGLPGAAQVRDAINRTEKREDLEEILYRFFSRDGQ